MQPQMQTADVYRAPVFLSTTFKVAVSRAEAAAMLCISASTFDDWVRRGLMPKGIKIGSLRRWDVEEIKAAWRSIVEGKMLDEEDDGENPFDNVVG